MTRKKLVHDRLIERLNQVCSAVQPIRPGAQYWLDSDCGPSYCAECVLEARAAEMGLSTPPAKPIGFNWAQTDADQRAADLLEEFNDGIDGGFDTESDSAASCERCGKTLSYILTDEGVDSEVSHYREYPLSVVRDEDSYALDRIALNIWHDAPRHQLLGVALVVNQAWRIVIGQAVES